MIAGWTLAEAKKAVAAFVFAAAYIVGLLLLPGNADALEFQQVAVAVVGPVFGVIGVFAAKNHTPDDLQKAVEALIGASLTVVGYFVTVDASTAQQIYVIAGALISVFAVFWVQNEGRAAPGA
jgi:hypothetical protein